MDDYYKVNAFNLFGLIDVTKTFLPLVKKTKGRVVNTGKRLRILVSSSIKLFVDVSYSVKDSDKKKLTIMFYSKYSWESCRCWSAIRRQ